MPRLPPVLLRLMLLLAAALAGNLLSLSPSGPALAEESVMNWRATLPQVRSRQDAPAYRARRRSDVAPRYPDDASLGLLMPALKL
ncbi:MAG: hypothetical protein ACK5TM_08310, partial [Methylobacterium sp.]